MTRSRIEPLLCELHAHTTWSDGALSLRQLVDIYGRRGFDVLCVTDHTLRTDDPRRGRQGVRRQNYPSYLRAIEQEAERARWAYGLLLIPSLELTYNDVDPLRAAHAVAVGLREFVGMDDGLDRAIRAAREAGAAIIAAHPFRTERHPLSARNTLRFAYDGARLAGLVDRWELFSRTELFPWVAEAGLPGVASGDFHVPEHLAGWKTLLPCRKDEEAVVAYLRSKRPVYLARLDADAPIGLAA